MLLRRRCCGGCHATDRRVAVGWLRVVVSQYGSGRTGVDAEYWVRKKRDAGEEEREKEGQTPRGVRLL